MSEKQKAFLAGVVSDQRDAIVAALEKDGEKWLLPFFKGAGSGCNAKSGHVYRGSNVWYTLAVQSLRGYRYNRWLTFKQSKSLGGRVKPGQGKKAGGPGAIPIRHCSPRLVDDRSTGEKKCVGWNVRIFHVWNVDQIEGLPQEVIEGESVKLLPEGERIAHAEAACSSIEKGLDLSIEIGGDRACYSSSRDVMRLPDFGQFRSAESFYSTRLHELSHASGHKSRLNRSLANPFGSEEYAFEELIAEFSSAFLCRFLGIEGNLQHPEYIRSWVKALKAKPEALMQASGKAEAAFNFLLEAGGLKVEEAGE